MKRRSRRIAVAACFAVGGLLLQLGPCFMISAITDLASLPIPKLLDENQLLFGLFAVCGQPNIQFVDENNVPQGPILNTEDDLVFFCPVRQVRPTPGGSGG